MIVFHAKASHAVGMGHLVRCRALAEEFAERNVPCVMTGPGRKLMSATDNGLFAAWRASPMGGDNVARTIVAAMRDFNGRFLIIDDPDGSVAYRDTLASCSIEWLEFKSRHEPNAKAKWIVNQRPRMGQADYAANDNGSRPHALLGPGYAPIRRAFRRPCSPRCELNKIVAIFGGGDDRGMHERVVEALGASPSPYEVILVCGKANPNTAQLASLVASIDHFNIVVDPTNLPELLCSADLVITAGGTTTYELAALAVPMIIVAVADNQVAQSTTWAGLGAATYLGRSHDVDAGTLANAIESLAQSPEERISQSHRARKLCDGLGAQRIVDAMLCGSVAAPEHSTDTI